MLRRRSVAASALNLIITLLTIACCAAAVAAVAPEPSPRFGHSVTLLPAVRKVVVLGGGAFGGDGDCEAKHHGSRLSMVLNSADVIESPASASGPDSITHTHTHTHARARAHTHTHIS